MNRFFKNQISVILPMILLLGFVGLFIAKPDPLEDFQLRFFDFLQRMQPRVYRDTPVTIVDIDNESLARLGQWPWPRIQVAELITRLAKAEAAVVVLDIVFAESDRTSPKNILPLWSKNLNTGPLRSEIAKLPDHDDVLAQAVSGAQVVTGFSLINQPNPVKPALKAGFAFSGDDPVEYLPLFRGAVTNLPAIESAAAGNGSFNILAERDGILRRVPLLFRLRSDLYPSLYLEALRTAQGAASYIVKSAGASREVSFGEHTGISSVKVGNYIVPTDAEGKIWLYDTGIVKERTLPAWKIFADDFNRKRIAGSIVFIGTSAEGLKDQRTTPLNPLMPGVEVHAQLTEQILLGEFLNRPDWAPGAELCYLIVLGLFLILLMQFVGPVGCAVLGLLAIGGAFEFSWYMFTHERWLLDPVLPSLEVLVIYLCSSLINYLKTAAEKRNIRNAFSRYMSPVLVEKLAKNPDKLKLGGETKNMTVLFSDIRGFTTLSEKFEAEELTLFLNRFLTPMTDIILGNFGTVDKYMGDAILAFWNAPLDDASHAEHACRAALEMRATLAALNGTLANETKFKEKNLSEIAIGIGINTGDCCVGNLGSDQRFDYSVLGDTVNLTSRLENLSKRYGFDIILGENTYQQVPGFGALEIDLIRVKGKTQPARVYALLGDEKVKHSQAFQTIEGLTARLLNAYRSQCWQEAKKLIEECLEAEQEGMGLSGYYRMMDSRIDFYLSHPPAADWDGISIAESK